MTKEDAQLTQILGEILILRACIFTKTNDLVDSDFDGFVEGRHSIYYKQWSEIDQEVLKALILVKGQYTELFNKLYELYFSK